MHVNRGRETPADAFPNKFVQRKLDDRYTKAVINKQQQPAQLEPNYQEHFSAKTSNLLVQLMLVALILNVVLLVHFINLFVL